MLFTCQLLYIAFSKHSAEVSRHSSCTVHHHVKSEQSPKLCHSACRRIPHLVPVAASGNSVVQSSLPRSPWTSVIKGTNKSLHLDFQDWTIFTFLVITQYLTWPRLPCQKKPLKTWKVYLSHLLWLMAPWSCEKMKGSPPIRLVFWPIPLPTKDPSGHATMQIYCIKGKIKTPSFCFIDQQVKFQNELQSKTKL